MQDEKIIELFFERDEKALNETEAKYGNFCRTVASNILSMREDREECLNDLLLALWNNIPPERPRNLKAYIAKIVRNLALKKTRSENVWRRCKSFSEIGEEFIASIPDTYDLIAQFESDRAGEILNELLESLPEHERDVFVLRYYFGENVAYVAADMGFSEGKVKSILFRTRKKFAQALQKEGILV
jgi:RNA polymerase sigma-70 factor (ECF subfamily)